MTICDICRRKHISQSDDGSEGHHSDLDNKPDSFENKKSSNDNIEKTHKSHRRNCKKNRSSVDGGDFSFKIIIAGGRSLNGVNKNVQQRRSDHFSPNSADVSTLSPNDSRSRSSNDDAFESPRTACYLQTQFCDDNKKLLSGFYDEGNDDKDEPKILKYIDTHCHLDLLFRRTNCFNKCEEYGLDDFRKKQEVVTTWSPNFGGCITDFCFPENYSYSKALNSVKKCDDVWIAIGCHPHSANKYGSQVENQIKQLASDPKVVAVGEMGLDYSKNNNTKHELQEEILKKQVEIAKQLNKPILLHCRDAEDDCYKIFKEFVPRDHKIHWHCYSEGWETAQKWQNNFTNIYFGVTLGIYSPRAGQEEFWKNCPPDRLVIETDSPYFLPRHYKRTLSHCHPGLGALVATKLAEYRTEKIANILKQTLENTKKLYDIHL